MSHDPTGISDDTNMYRYVKNNPLKYNDPMGLELTFKNYMDYVNLDLQTENILRQADEKSSEPPTRISQHVTGNAADARVTRGGRAYEYAGVSAKDFAKIVTDFGATYTKTYLEDQI